tara:strand:+ start:86 stop:454 length:369 start_codon:yes stop_codon:yes gene_type:complete
MNKVRRGRGRPKFDISDEERVARKKESARKSSEKLKLRNLTIDGDLLERFTRLKDIRSKKIQVDLTNRQFFKLLLINMEETYGGSTIILEAIIEGTLNRGFDPDDAAWAEEELAKLKGESNE